LVKPYHIEGIEALISHHTQGKNWLLHDSQTGILGISFCPPKRLSPTFEENHLKQGHFMDKTQVELPGGSVPL